MSLELRVAVVALIGVIGIFFGLGAVLPQQWEVETSTVVPGPPDRVLPLLRDFNAWRRWSTIVDASERTDTRVTVEGEAGTIGHRIVWRQGQNEGVFRLAQIAGDGIDYQYLTRLGDGELDEKGRGTLRVEAAPQGSLVSWREVGRVSGFGQRWFAWFGAAQDAMKQIQTASLAGLCNAIEGK